MKHKTITMKASELIEDFDIYPRNGVYNGHVYELAEAIRAGSVLPPIIADAKSKRLTDGVHTRRAHICVGGPDVEVEVTLVEYKNVGEMICDAIARNASHGRRLTTVDFARCTLLAKRCRVSRERLAGLLNVTRDRLADVTATRFAKGANGDVLLRRPMAHLADTQLTPAQEEVAAHVGGQATMQHVNQLIKLVDSNSLPDDDNLLERLQMLHEVLEGWLATKLVAA